MAVLVFIILVFLFIFAIDGFFNFYTWQSRIHIGRFQDRQSWALKVSEKSRAWLKNTPVIKLTDNKRLIIFDILNGNYKRSSIQHWQEAALVLGLSEQYNATKIESLKNEINSFLKSKFDSSGNWKVKPNEIDGVILAYAVINLKFIDPHKFKPAYDAMYSLVKSLVGEDGTAAYRTYMTGFRYVDTIGFICPFLISYGVRFQIEEAIELGCRQINIFNRHGMLSGAVIPCHTYDVKTKLPVGLFGWGRGLGWYAIGLIDSWKALPESHLLKPEMTASVHSFALMAMNFQRENGSWNWIVMDATARADSSATATLAWFLANASEINEISAKCEIAKTRALNYLMTVTQRSGAIDFSQGDTKGIGMYSHEFNILPFTQGFALRTNFHES